MNTTMNTAMNTARMTLLGALIASTATLALWASSTTAQAGQATDSTTGSSCHLSRQEVSSWGETSARLTEACDKDAFTVLDHPALPCHLSKADVNNWGETSAHLPQACEYFAWVTTRYHADHLD